MQVIVRALTMFVILFLVVKLLGKKQIKNLTLYDYVLSISMGSIAADSVISLDTPLYDGILALLVFAVVGYLASILSLHSHNVEEIVDGETLILFENDNFNYKNLETAKLSVSKLLENIRVKGCFDINELDTAILEPSGDISILLKENSRPITSNDLKTNIQKNNKKKSLNYNIIIDGVLNLDELKKAKKSKTWLNKILKENELNIEDITLLSIDKCDNITLFDRKEK